MKPKEKAIKYYFDTPLLDISDDTLSNMIDIALEEQAKLYKKEIVCLKLLNKRWFSEEEIRTALDKHKNADNLGDYGFLDRYKRNVLKELTKEVEE